MSKSIIGKNITLTITNNDTDDNLISVSVDNKTYNVKGKVYQLNK